MAKIWKECVEYVKFKVKFIVGKNKLCYSLGEKLEMKSRHIHKYVVKSAQIVRNGVDYGFFKRCSEGGIDWGCQRNSGGERWNHDGFHGNI